MPLNGYSYHTIQQFLGCELGVSDWLTVDQDRIYAFADCTEDHQWIHIDIERARQESPWGTTIAHGYLTLSLLPRLQFGAGVFPAEVSQVVNYGLDKVRFIAPVKVGKRIRNRVMLLSVEDKGQGRLLKTQNTVEIDGEEKPAMVAETLFLVIGRSD
jgi:acyl dehydratase